MTSQAAEPSRTPAALVGAFLTDFYALVARGPAGPASWSTGGRTTPARPSWTGPLADVVRRVSWGPDSPV